MIDYSLDIVEVNGEDRSKRGKRGDANVSWNWTAGAAILPESNPAPEAPTMSDPTSGTLFLPARYRRPPTARTRPAGHRRLRTLKLHAHRLDQTG